MVRKLHLGLLALVCALAAPTLLAPSALAAECGISLDDTSGLEWDIDGSEGYVSDGEEDAYDSYGYAYIGANDGLDNTSSYSNLDSSACSYEDGDREIVFPKHQDIGSLGVDLTRKVYVPSAGKPFARWLDIVTNPTSETKSIVLEWYGNYGEVYGGVAADENENGLVDLGERWASFDQDGDGGDTEFASLWDGPDADGWDRPYGDDETNVPGDDDEDSVDFIYADIVIPPGGTAVFMHIEHQNTTVAGAAAFARANGDGTNEFFAGMSAEEIQALRNWSADPDKDGVLLGSDNCPEVANADQGDLDADRLGDACDDDVDGDGLSNAQEERLGMNPRAADSDGDGVVDGFDQCPTRAGSESGCPPTATAATAQPVILDRLAPNRLTLNVRRSRPAKRRLRLRNRGRILLPAGMTAAQGCTAGSVIVTVKAGGNTVSTRIADLEADCTYRSSVTFGALRRLGRRALVVRAQFTGNDRLSRRNSSRVSAGRA